MSSFKSSDDINENEKWATSRFRIHIESSSLTLKAREKYCNFEHFYQTVDAKTNIDQIETNILKLFRK